MNNTISEANLTIEIIGNDLKDILLITINDNKQW